MSPAFLESTSLSTRALDFLLDLHDADAGREELIGTLCGVAEELQSGAIAGGTIIDARGATFERVVFPSLPYSPFSTFQRVVAADFLRLWLFRYRRARDLML